MSSDIEKIKDYLIENNIRASYPRIKIFEYLVVNKNHPTVDMIYTHLVKELPTLSKTTVYNTLKLFIEEKIAVVVTIEEGEARYDADVTNHGHFKCSDCGEVYDFRFNEMDLRVEGLGGFKVNQKNVYYLGLCRNCLKDN